MVWIGVNDGDIIELRQGCRESNVDVVFPAPPFGETNAIFGMSIP